MTNENVLSIKALRKRNLTVIAVECVICLALNFLLFKFADVLGLPLYLDNVGTLLAAILGGYLPGIFVGFMTNIINCATDPTSIYYGFITVLIAVTSSFFAHKGCITIRKPHWLIVLIIILALIGGGIGTLLPWLLDDVYFDSESFSAVLVNAGITDTTLAQLLGNIIMDVLDKAVTVGLVIIILALIPPKVRSVLEFSGWMQKKMSDEDKNKLRHIGVRKISVRTKIMLILIVALIIMGTVATGISFVLFSNATIEQHFKLVEGVTNVITDIVDGDSVDRWMTEGESSEGYTETENLLYTILNSDDDIEYIYIYKILEDGCHVVFDLDVEGLAGGNPGDIVPFDESFAPYIPTLLAGEEIEPIITNDTFGNLLTVYKPIKDSSGNTVAYAAADVSMRHVEKYERNFSTGMISLFLAFFMVVFAVVLWVVEYHIVLPVNSMAECTDSFAFQSNEELETHVKRLNELGINTGDEIENLYHAVSKMASDSVDHLEDIQNKNETIKKMQNALIIVLADLVESRDKNTGDHVRKTAAYTKIIMEKMRELGYYTDTLTDEFIESVVDSAPLHDIGKIKVSDMILNKPGRLTDDEFVKMQSHAAEGSNILDQVIELVPDSDYLYEARNLAHYHHEKWNGRGYPDGISGENIPLSARIMAVADVFDALVSKRSYKDPFSFEQACDIIREGAGTHFDPKVAEAFLAAQEEAKKVAESFGKLKTGYTEDTHVDDSGKSR
ncbi:MAG: HD domain-containing protein [Ruminiclostridium sp.]|nr:HD domain-containing protein [Ruminiclostridium sp.]